MNVVEVADIQISAAANTPTAADSDTIGISEIVALQISVAPSETLLRITYADVASIIATENGNLVPTATENLAIQVSESVIGNATMDLSETPTVSIAEMASVVATEGNLLEVTVTESMTLRLTEVSPPEEIVQQVHTQSGAVANGNTTTPFDDSVPQNTEGTQFMSLSITPLNASDILVIEAIVHATTSTPAWVIVSLFQDSTANALAATTTFVSTANVATEIPFRHRMVAGTTSSTTFNIRVGPHTAATVTFNGQLTTNRKFGGTFASSLTITERLP